jgi:hypothetical protein
MCTWTNIGVAVVLFGMGLACVGITGFLAVMARRIYREHEGGKLND